MKVVVLSLALLTLLIFGSTTSSQSQQPMSAEHKAKLLDVPSSFRPKLSLENALDIAKKFTTSENIDMTHFWLYRATFMLFGGSTTPDKDKIPGWHFWWVNDSGAQGNYVEIFVSMDGRCRRLPSM